MKKMKITEILKNQTITNQFDFKGTCPDKDGVLTEFTIFETAYFLSKIKHLYFNRVTFIEDPENAFTEFVNEFNEWKKTRGLHYARLMYAYSLAYNPIENYDSTETLDRTDDLEHGLSTERTYDEDKVTRTYNQDKVTHHYNQDKIEYGVDAQAPYKETTTYDELKDTQKNGRYGVNSSTLVDVNENSNERNGDVINKFEGKRYDLHTGNYDDEHTGSYDDEHSGGYTDANTGHDITDTDYTLTKHGNIGVSTVAGMTSELFHSLKDDLQKRALCEYLDEYTFYSGEVDLW